MSRHTPGPWVASVSVSDHGGWKSPEQYVEISTDERLIAMYSTASSEYPPDAENEANARLIAAAPKMLDVLQKIDAHGYTTGADYDMVRDAIAAATGEPA